MKYQEGNVFIGVCLFTGEGVLCPGGGCLSWGSMSETPGTCLTVGGMHPTGMHSCQMYISWLQFKEAGWIQQTRQEPTVYQHPFPPLPLTGYRSGTVNSKSFVGKVLLQIK